MSPKCVVCKGLATVNGETVQHVTVSLLEWLRIKAASGVVLEEKRGRLIQKLGQVMLRTKLTTYVVAGRDWDLGGGDVA